jgi:hypothetical protein
VSRMLNWGWLHALNSCGDLSPGSVTTGQPDGDRSNMDASKEESTGDRSEGCNYPDAAGRHGLRAFD